MKKTNQITKLYWDMIIMSNNTHNFTQNHWLN